MSDPPDRQHPSQPIPFDAPGSVLFDGNSVIVGNQSSIEQNTAHTALLKVDVG